jgi:TctA family transporter
MKLTMKQKTQANKALEPTATASSVLATISASIMIFSFLEPHHVRVAVAQLGR